MENGFVQNFVRLLNDNNLDGASLKTVVDSPITYWDKGLDFRWKLLMNRKEKITVLGTPSLYKKSMLEDENFNSQNFGPSDDTDLGDRLLNKGYKLGIVDLRVFDKNMWNYNEIYSRFKWYGTGDYYYYRNNSNKWSIARKIKSLTHPLRQFGSYSYSALRSGSPTLVGWFIVTVVARYHGWVSKILTH